MNGLNWKLHTFFFVGKVCFKNLSFSDIRLIVQKNFMFEKGFSQTLTKSLFSCEKIYLRFFGASVLAVISSVLPPKQICSEEIIINYSPIDWITALLKIIDGYIQSNIINIWLRLSQINVICEGKITFGSIGYLLTLHTCAVTDCEFRNLLHIIII